MGTDNSKLRALGKVFIDKDIFSDDIDNHITVAFSPAYCLKKFYIWYYPRGFKWMRTNKVFKFRNEQ